MNSDEKSSEPDGDRRDDEVEWLGGVVHPHDIEIQDFSVYDLIVDLRTPAEYAEDHLPGAINVDLTTGFGTRERSTPSTVEEPQPVDPTPETLATAIGGVKPTQQLLLYCGSGGRVSVPLAKSLRWRGLSVDVLGGGYVNYRRWVEAALVILPSMVTWRLVHSPLRSDVHAVLSALARAGEQVLDFESLAQGDALHDPAESQGPGLSQAAFDGLLVAALRGVDPRGPVWVPAVKRDIGALRLSSATRDCLSLSPVARIEVPSLERVRHWRTTMPTPDQELDIVIRSLEGTCKATTSQVLQWREWLSAGRIDDVMVDLLPFLPDGLAEDAAQERTRLTITLPPLVAPSLDREVLDAAVRDWLSGLT